jgi:ATP-binding cassette, subfamily B, bacterial
MLIDRIITHRNENLSNHVIYTSSKSLFKDFFFNSIKPYWKLLVGQVIVAIIRAADFVLRPYLIKTIVDIISTVHNCTNLEMLYKQIVLYLCLTIFVFFTARFYGWLVLKFRPNLIKHIGLTLMQRLMKHSHTFFQNQFTGSLANKINDVASGISNILSTLIDQFFAQIFALSLAVYTIASININLAILLIAWIVVFLFFSLKFAKKAALLSKITAHERSSVVGSIVDVLGNMFSVRVFVTANYEANSLSNLYQKWIYSFQTRDWFFMKMHVTQEVSFIVYQTSCLWWLFQSIKLKNTTPGDFVLIMMLNIAIINLLYSISKNIREFSESFGNVQQGLSTIYLAIENANCCLKNNRDEIVVHKGEIRFVNASFKYNDSNNIFNKMFLTIPSMQKVGLVGYSGSGKTTFIHLILGLFELTRGQILIDNQDITLASKESLQKSIGVIPQEISLFNRSIMENIRYGNIYASDEEVIEAAQKAKAHEFIMRLPNGYSSLVGEKGVKLSGGERQRIAIARAILKNAPILLLDESTNQLDSVTEESIRKSLEVLMKEKTTIVIAHRLSTLLNLDRILVFDQGKIVQDGTHDKLIKQSGLYKTLWDRQLCPFSKTA